MSTDSAHHTCAPSRRRQSNHTLLGTACAVGLACALATAAAPAEAKTKSKIDAETAAKLKHKEAERRSKEPFGKIPKGPLQIIISIDQQKLHLYSDGVHVTDAPIASGVEQHPTPMGVFSVIDKERYHESNIYSGAPMPFMQRITWSGVAMHEGVGLGHPASHGCIRMPREFAEHLWALPSLGARVIIARPQLKLEAFADPHLFVHKERPPAPASAESVKTAQSVDASKKTDAGVASVLAAPTDETPAVAPQADPAARLATNTDASKDAAAGAPPAHDVIDPPAAPAEPGTSATAAARDPAPAQPIAPANIETGKAAADGAAKPSVDAALEVVPVPIPKPADLLRGAIGAPIAIFVSRKTSRIYVRQRFSPLFDAPITIEHPEQPLGTHVFTAMEYLADGSTFRWNVVSLPGEPLKAARNAEKESERKTGRRRRGEHEAKPILDPPPSQTPRQALARIEIPQDAIDRISELMVAGSSLVVSDQGLGEETGEGTDFIVVTR